MKKGRKLAESESYGKAQDTVRKYAADKTGSKGRAPPKGGVKYNLTFDIAKASDGRTILYTAKGKIKKVGNAEVHSLKIRGAEQNSNFDESITDESENVKTYREPERLNELRRQNERKLAQATAEDAVDSGSSLELFVQIMYAGKKKESIADISDATKASEKTSETSAGTAPNTNIPNTSKNVNEIFPRAGETQRAEAAE